MHIRVLSTAKILIYKETETRSNQFRQKGQLISGRLTESDWRPHSPEEHLNHSTEPILRGVTAATLEPSPLTL